MNWNSLTANGFEGVEVVDSTPGVAGGLKVYSVIQRPLTTDPQAFARVGVYDADTQRWDFYFYPLVPDLVGARNAIVLSEIRHIGGDEFLILERDQRRTGSSSGKRIYRVLLASGAPNDVSNPLEKVLAVDLLNTPFRFDFEKVESIAVTPNGTFVVNDNDGGEEGVFFYRLNLVAGETTDTGVSGGSGGTGGAGSAGAGGSSGGGAGGAGGGSGAGGSGGAGGSSGGGATVVINEVSSNPNPDWVELVNRGSSPVDLGGWALEDEGGGRFDIPAGTIIPANGLLTFDQALFGFGLGAADGIRLLAPGAVLADSASWLAHVSTLDRCPNGSGSFTTLVATKNAPNACP